MSQITWKNRITTGLPLDVSQASVVEILHDHGFLITLSPIVTRYQERGREGSKIRYDVWENIELLPFGLWRREIQFSAEFENTPDGVVSWIEAPLGVRSQATYVVEATDPKQANVSLDERITSSCNLFLKLFVESTMVATRKKMHVRILENVKERQ